MKPEPFFVVMRLDKEGRPYIDSTYETMQYVNLRVKHLKELDGVDSWYSRVEAPYLHPIENPERFMFPRGAVMTVGRGIELIDYGPRELRRLSLGQAVEDAWTSWREAQAAAGNLEEAAQEPPAIPPELFEEHGGTLKLHPQDLP